MVSITVSLEEETTSKMEYFPWVNWSEVGREEALKKEIFERFIKTGTLSDDDQEFCDKIDWYPVDELELREEFVEELKKARKEPSGKSMSIEEFNKWCESL